MADPKFGRNARRNNKSKSKSKKSPSSNERLRKGSMGTNAISAVQRWATNLQPLELKFPQNIETFHEMYTRDEAVGGVLNATYALVESAFSSWTIEANHNSPESVKTKNLLKYIFDNMTDSTLRSFSRNAATFNQFGFSVIEKDYKKLPVDDYLEELPSGVNKDSLWMIDKLRFIPQRSLDSAFPFIIGDQGRDILGIKQNSAWFQSSSHVLHSWTPPSEAVIIPRNKFMLMGINVTDSTPMGVSPLEQVWTSWKEKKFYERYQSVGVSKDMAGMPLLELPLDILNKANLDPSGPEGLAVQAMVEDVASMHAGEQNMMMLPSDVSSNTKDYNLSFLGVSGAGKQFDLQSIITKLREAIYSSFGALNLISSETGGSYNQLEGQNAIHFFFVKRIISIIEESINQDLIPQILKINKIKLPYKDIPKFKSGEIEPMSGEELSKIIQRVKSVNGLVLSKPVILAYHKNLQLPTEDLEDMELDELHRLMEVVSKGDSRSGESDGTSGTGDSQSAGNENNSDNTA